MRDYVPEEELEARPFLSAAQVRRAVSRYRYRRAEHPPTSRISREAANQYMDRFKAPVQDNGDQDAVGHQGRSSERGSGSSSRRSHLHSTLGRSGGPAACWVPRLLLYESERFVSA